MPSGDTKTTRVRIITRLFPQFLAAWFSNNRPKRQSLRRFRITISAPSLLSPPPPSSFLLLHPPSSSFLNNDTTITEKRPFAHRKEAYSPPVNPRAPESSKVPAQSRRSHNNLPRFKTQQLASFWTSWRCVNRTIRFRSCLVSFLEK